MALKTFCDICEKEIKDREENISIWSPHSSSYCLGCWTDKANWPKVHKIPEKKRKRYHRPQL